MQRLPLFLPTAPSLLEKKKQQQPAVLPSDPTTLIPHEARGLAMKAPSSRQCPQIIESWRSDPMKFSAQSRPGPSNWDFFSSLWLSVQAKGVDVLKVAWRLNDEVGFTRVTLSLLFDPLLYHLHGPPSTLRGLFLAFPSSSF